MDVLQAIKVPILRNRESFDVLSSDKDMIFVPQRHIGQGVGEMSLKLLIQVFLFLRVLGAASLVNQKVGLPAPKAAAIRAVRGGWIRYETRSEKYPAFSPQPRTGCTFETDRL